MDTATFTVNAIGHVRAGEVKLLLYGVATPAVARAEEHVHVFGRLPRPEQQARPEPQTLVRLPGDHDVLLYSLDRVNVGCVKLHSLFPGLSV